MEDKRFLPLLLALLVLCGCAGSIERWIVNTRLHQGEIAMADGNPADAVVAYSLALRVAPHNAAARSGFVDASAAEAQSLYTHGRFDDALAAIGAGLKIDPSSVTLDALKSQIGDAKLKQEIVISNYPLYQRAGQEIEQSYLRLNQANALIVRSLHRFGYTYDVADLTQAIRRSYQLQLEVQHDMSRLVAYRQLVQSGGPQAVEVAPATGGSLLPLP